MRPPDSEGKIDNYVLWFLQLPNVWTGWGFIAGRTHIVQQSVEARQAKASESDEQIENGEEDKIADSANGITNEGECPEKSNATDRLHSTTFSLFSR